MRARLPSGRRFLGEPALLRGLGHVVHRVPDGGVVHAQGGVPTTRALRRARASSRRAPERLRAFLQGGLGDPRQGAR
eukprot:6372571-Pyramimonas_sp.AAC.1